jgi:uncharacterized protein YggE
MKPALVAALALLSSGLDGRPASASDATPADPPPSGQFRESVLVSGTGDVSGTPDTLTADFAAEADGSTVGEAVDRADFAAEADGSTVGEAVDRATAAATRMRDALVRAGIATADLQTSAFSVGSKVDDHQAITGYTATEGLTAKIRELPRAGQVMSAAIAAGGDAARLNGVSFAIDNDAALLAKARRGAFADARRKAELYAHEAGRPLGRVLDVSETTPGYGGPAPVAMDSRFSIEPGRQRLTVTVTVQWALDPPPRPGSNS